MKEVDLDLLGVTVDDLHPTEIKIENLLEYRTHPRLLEIRLIATYHLLVREYDAYQARDIIEKLCSIFRIPFTMVWKVISQENRIRNAMFVSTQRYNQEVIFMGELWGETRYTVATKFLNMKNYNYLYQDKERHNYQYFITNEWLAELDNEVAVAGATDIRNTITNFLESLDRFIDLF